MENIPITEIINVGANGLVAWFCWNLIQQNRELLTEIRNRDDCLLQLINRLIDLEEKWRP